MSLRRPLLLAFALATLSQALVLGLYYVGTAGCACAITGVGAPPSPTSMRALEAMRVVEPLFYPAPEFDLGALWRGGESPVPDLPGQADVWSAYVLQGAANAVFWTFILGPVLWLAGGIGRWASYRWRARRAV